MGNNPQDKWYFRKSSLIFGFLLVGPFILPLVWSNPNFSNKRKMSVTIIVIILTCILLIMSAKFVKTFVDFYQQAANLNF